ncbi:MAG: FAD-binding protein [Phycisphaerales bacterium]|nr:FAD-binding protein [Phycisphaerales bacterium]MCI0676601.1 FAD-binding protein [Phycisphaerales bacterium]
MTAVDRFPLPVIKWQDPSRSSGVSLARVAQDLRSLISGEVRFSRHDRMLYSTDASLYQVEPLGVVCPRTVEEAERVVRYCGDHGLPVLPRGGGTSLAGQAVNRAIVIDFSVHCRNVIEIDADQRTALVEPGVTLDALNAEAARFGLMFGPDVASGAQANMGGMIGNNSAGARSILYGRTVEHLQGIRALLADGSVLHLHENAVVSDLRIREITRRVVDAVAPLETEIEARFPKTVRRVNGYNLDLVLQQVRRSSPGTFDKVNLAHLICGSEGTLAITMQAQLNLVPMPRCLGLAIMSFANVEEALGALVSVLATNPSAVELIDDVVIGLAQKNLEYRRYVELLPTSGNGIAGAVLYVEYFGDSHDDLAHHFDELQSRFRRQAINRYTEAHEMNRAWKLRRAGEPLLHSLPGHRKPITFIEDLAVNPERLAQFVGEFRELAARHGTTASYYAHASVGCLHMRPLIDLHDQHDRSVMQAIVEEATDLVVRYGGALSGEHGDGRVRSHLLERFYGREICEGFGAIKAIFDPRNLLNPGNIVEPEPMLEHLRVRPDRQFIHVPQVKTYFRYQREGGFGEAIERCNGAGVCRKLKGGTMCPSYRATLDERHVTRGRANALRLAITGQFGADGNTPLWNDSETKKTLDLCLSCKACKSECPSNVDLAKLKAEYLAQGYRQSGGIPFSSRVFGRIRMFNRLGSAIHPIANLFGQSSLARTMISGMIGLHPQRSLPRFGQSLYRWMSGRKPSSRSEPAVVLFPDCFTVYNEPHIGRAAIETLERLGYRVVLPRLGCCGRAMISTGMLPQACDTCRRSASDLLRCVESEQAVAVVGCEPSCVSAIKDDWLDLEMGVDSTALDRLAAKTFLVEQFIEEHWTDHPLTISASGASIGPEVILHGHCHQKALWGVESSSRLLERLLGDRLHVLDSGCCGMAGSFGYTKDHYELSMKIGELSLFRELRQNREAIVAAPGTSCRQQIADGMARQALHPIELVEQLIRRNART